VVGGATIYGPTLPQERRDGAGFSDYLPSSGVALNAAVIASFVHAMTGVSFGLTAASLLSMSASFSSPFGTFADAP